MSGTNWGIVCLAYIIGLLSTGFLGFASTPGTWQTGGLLALGWVVGSAIAGIAVPRFWRTGPRFPLWLVAGGVAIGAIAYLQFRTPQPSPTDPSRLVPQLPEEVTVRGTIIGMPTLNRSSKLRFLLAAEQVNEQAVSGKIYTTLPLLQGTGLVPGVAIALRGKLYQPQPPTHPGAFDFQSFLARQGVFSGLSGTLIEPPLKTPWGWWKLRRRIVRAQVRGSGSPIGQLVSSMVLGRRAVDLPFDLQDSFRQAGLSHVLAASGFHVSLLLGVLLALTRKLGARTRLGVGLVTLLAYIGLTGVQPSVMRAALMGAGVLAALSAERKVKPLGLLLLAAVVLLVVNPLWIWDLGFQLSFLATLGLIVTVPPLVKRLDWLPPAIATLMAVPLAASVWTLPLLIYVFNTIATYSLVVNVIATPLISLISLGGMISAAVALVFPPAGSAIAWLLYYPARVLLAIVQFFTQLPGSARAVGTISLGQLLVLYGLIALVWLVPWMQRRWGLAAFAAVLFVAVPVAYKHSTQFQVTILPAQPAPAIVIQDRGKVTAIATPDEETARYVLLPFLRNQGLNAIDLAVSTENTQGGGWGEVFANLRVKVFLGSSQPQKRQSEDIKRIQYEPFQIGQGLKLGSTVVRVLSQEPPALQIQIQDRDWLLVGANTSTPEARDRFLQTLSQQQFDVLLWSGATLGSEALDMIEPKVAIAPSFTLPPQSQPQAQLYAIERDGTVQWTPQRGWETLSQRE
ncbi:MAG: ComEC/Rec2 family competence protein [Cyanobacteriota bacterium]|nr:ComEC/Rec2 family competence protein [Cyanobacteriota bacterium]